MVYLMLWVMVRVCEKMQIKHNNNLAQSREDFFLNLELAGFFFILKLCFLNTTDFNYYLSLIEIKTCFIVLFTLFCSFYLPCLRDNKAISVNVQSLRSMFITSLRSQKLISFAKSPLTKEFNLIDFSRWSTPNFPYFLKYHCSPDHLKRKH